MTNMNKNAMVPFSGLTKQVWDFADLVLKNRFAKALDTGAARFPVFRELRFAARIELEVLLDAIALDPAWRAERIHGEYLILDADGLFVSAHGIRKVDYCSCVFYLWAADLARAEEAKQRILDKAGSTRITEPMGSRARRAARSSFRPTCPTSATWTMRSSVRAAASRTSTCAR